jgi:hypothetical protein
MPNEFHIRIGDTGWEQSLRSETAELSPNFWVDFEAVSLQEIERLENVLQRDLPGDFKLFLTTFGCGNFPSPFWGGFFTPREVIDGCAGPLFMLLGSGSWASHEDQRRFYVTRGTFNPAPDKFIATVINYAGVDLLDLVQVGYDGMSCYYQLICPAASDSRPGFCKITPEGAFEDRHPSFEAGLNAILSEFREYAEDRRT